LTPVESPKNSHTGESLSSKRTNYYIVVRPSVVVCLSVVCNVRAPYSVGWNFRQCFYAVWYPRHPLMFAEFFHGDRPRGTPLLGGGLKL